MRPSLPATSLAGALLLCALLVPCALAHSVVSVTRQYASGMVEQYDPPLAGIATNITFVLADVQAGRPLGRLDIVHGRAMHVFIVGSDLATFAHTHPDDYPGGLSASAQGEYTIAHTFAQPGTYLVAIDYTVAGTNVLQSFPLYVLAPPLGDAAPLPPPDDRETREWESDGYDVSLEGPGRIVAGQEAALTYHIEHDGEDVTDLQQLLGSEMHLFVVMENLTSPGHTHAYVPGHGLHLGAMPQRYIGPNIPVRYTFPEAGTYALFGQFQRNGTIVTSRMVLRVEQGRAFPWRAAIAGAAILVALCAAVALVRTGRPRSPPA